MRVQLMYTKDGLAKASEYKFESDAEIKELIAWHTMTIEWLIEMQREEQVTEHTDFIKQLKELLIKE